MQSTSIQQVNAAVDYLNFIGADFASDVRFLDATLLRKAFEKREHFRRSQLHKQNIKRNNLFARFVEKMNATLDKFFVQVYGEQR